MLYFWVNLDFFFQKNHKNSDFSLFFRKLAEFWILYPRFPDKVLKVQKKFPIYQDSNPNFERIQTFPNFLRHGSSRTSLGLSSQLYGVLMVAYDRK